MSENPISPAIQQFIAQHIQSVEELEILCLLGKEPSEFLQVGAIFRQIKSNESSIAGRLKKFAREKIVILQGDETYGLSPAHHKIVAELAASYGERQVSVLELIYKKPSPSIQDFSEAFRLKKKE
jgi:predicted transcriptional regulator